VIHTFTGGTDGSGPGNGLTFDKFGNLYGMTPTGGAFGFGVVYQLRPQPNGSWKLNVVHAFTGGNDGALASAGRLTIDPVQHIYGVTTAGGANGLGVAFEISRTQTGWNFLTLYAFKDSPDGGEPYGGLLLDTQGNLYGTAYYAGANDVGTVYKLSHHNGAWTETVLYSFQGGTDGSKPISTLVPDAAGNLYGTTSEGGAGCSCGTIFKMAFAAGKWTETVLNRFYKPSSAYAYSGLVADPAGKNFYGTTVYGGPANGGTIYQFIP
jgi:uncharacterized repeat protein (TIGR03803 family)